MRIGGAKLFKVRSNHLAGPTPSSGKINHNLQELQRLSLVYVEEVVLLLLCNRYEVVCKDSAISQQQRTAFFAELASACRLLQSLELVTSITLPPMVGSASCC